MEHFLTKLIHGVTDQSRQSVHRRFIKFSKGAFPNGGPVVRMKVSKKNNLAINGSFEYEDLIGYYVATHLSDGSCKVGGNIYTQPRVSLDSLQDRLKELSLSDGWVRGKRGLKNLFVFPMDLALSPQELIKIYENLTNDCYLLLSITPEKGKEWVFKSGEKIPPLKKTFGKAEPFTTCKPETKLKCKNAELCEKSGICITQRTKFCRTKTSSLNTEEVTDILELFLPDFPELRPTFTELLLINQYTITGFIFPEDKDSLSSKEIREKIKKVGFIERIVYIDNKMHSNKVEFTV
ncbi:MAG: hypothetical protein HWN66_16910 [Candidatus Helarchaeota archaeon]|nr:hypothetical protein [Candidatus Helarchaeota archaeon]